MKIYTRKEEFFKRYNLNGTAVPVTGKGYRMDYYTDENGTPFKAYLENYNGWWYATDWQTGVRINTCGYKTRKECAAFVEEVANRLPNVVLEYLQEHGNVYELGIPMTEEEYFRAVRAKTATCTDNDVEEAAEPAEPETTADEVQEVETAEPESEYNRFTEAFRACETLEDLKNVYTNEYSEAHYSVDDLSNLRRAWYNKFDEVQCVHRSMAGKVYSTESAPNHEHIAWFPEFVASISNMSDVEFHIEGTWLWVSGDTKPHREELKRMGLRWAPKRKMWYKKPAEKCPAAV